MGTEKYVFITRDGSEMARVSLGGRIPRVSEHPSGNLVIDLVVGQPFVVEAVVEAAPEGETEVEELKRTLGPKRKSTAKKSTAKRTGRAK
jgi:hypothetical protein